MTTSLKCCKCQKPMVVYDTFKESTYRDMIINVVAYKCKGCDIYVDLVMEYEIP